MPKIKTALISVSDKTNLVPLANFLLSQKIKIISTGGTARLLEEKQIPYTGIEEVTGNPESFDGRMKSISFQIGAGILYDRDKDTHLQQKNDLQIDSIDLVVCNLYPFKKVSDESSEEDKLIENIDIGGPTMIRAAAKNFKHVAVLCDPNTYDDFIKQFDSENSSIDTSYSKTLAKKAFALTAKYDSLIYNRLFCSEDSLEWPLLNSERVLRYGENPHQKAKVIQLENTKNPSLFAAKQLQGKELSYNNYLDMDAAWKSSYDCITSLESNIQSVSIVKHGNPCGIAAGNDQNTCLDLAWAGDPISAFGSIISFTSELSKESAEFLKNKFIEVIMAPNYSDAALAILKEKKNLRLIQIAPRKIQTETTYRSLSGTMLVSEEDIIPDQEFNCVTDEKWNKEDMSLLQFGSQVSKHLKSNGICLVNKTNNCFWLTGAGMGQPNRLEALEKLCIPRFQSKKDIKIQNSILVSDAFFPFADSIEQAAKFGIKKILQPGGSIKDQEVIDSCNTNKIAMAFTGRRHFRH